MSDVDRSHDYPCPDDDIIVRRISFQGLTTEIEAPRQAFADALSLTLGSYAAAVDTPVDLRIRIGPCDYPGWWRVITPSRTYRGNQNVAMAAQQVDWILTTQAVERLPGFIHVHAAVVATATRSILLIGRSGSGKSTTAVALAAAGLALYTDDVALIDRDTLCPIFVPRPVKLDDDALRLLEPLGLLLSPDARLGESVARSALPGLPPLDVAGPPLSLAIFFSPERRELPVVRELTAAEAALRLIQQSVSERVERGSLSEGAQGIIANVRSMELIAGRLDATVRTILGVVEGVGKEDRRSTDTYGTSMTP
jgi:hypothetical protein